MRDIKNCIFEFAYEIALRDATMRMSYKGPREELRKGEKAKAVKAAVREYIDAVLCGTADEEISFHDAAEKIGIAFRDTNFSFGNTQKLINMTAKYMFIACYNDDALRKNFKVCHCPMDGIMTDAVIKALKNVVEKTGNAKHKEKAAKYLKEKKLLKMPWSKMKNASGQYATFQEIVKFLSDCEDISPIEYDYLIWGTPERGESSRN